MAIQGLRSTEDFIGPHTGAGERPLNWRMGILMRHPNGHAPLVALTSLMRTRSTDDPRFQWWEREQNDRRIVLDAALDAIGGSDVVTVVAAASEDQGGGLIAVPGTILEVEESGELLLVTAVTSDTSITVTRSWGTVAATAVDPAVAGTNPNLLIVGTAYEEGQDTPDSVRFRPTLRFNFTQIFRRPLRATRTAMNTRLRTVQEIQDAKRQALLYHTIDMEYAFWFGDRVEDLTGAEPRRTTRGVVTWIEQDAPAVNNVDAASAGGPYGLTGDGSIEFQQFEQMMLEMFRFGSQEKMAFCGNRFLLAMQQVARRNANYDISPATREFGMNVRRFFSPFGTLVLKSHPLFNQNQSGDNGGTAFFGYDSMGVVVDMGEITYRPLKNSDTKYLPNRQGNGIDGLTSEYLTEAGIELAHARNHFIIRNLQTGVVDS